MTATNINPLKVEKITALYDQVLVTNMNFGERVSSGGIVLPSDDGKVTGIKPRWCQVYTVGPDQKDVKAGDWICVEHGRWTRVLVIEDDNGTHEIQKVDTDAILLISDSHPEDDFIPKVNF